LTFAGIGRWSRRRMAHTANTAGNERHVCS
jgi:hypothetical protein